MHPSRGAINLLIWHHSRCNMSMIGINCLQVRPLHSAHYPLTAARFFAPPNPPGRTMTSNGALFTASCKLESGHTTTPWLHFTGSVPASPATVTEICKSKWLLDKLDTVATTTNWYRNRKDKQHHQNTSPTCTSSEITRQCCVPRKEGNMADNDCDWVTFVMFLLGLCGLS
jgi:hypothetical protein